MKIAIVAVALLATILLFGCLQAPAAQAPAQVVYVPQPAPAQPAQAAPNQPIYIPTGATNVPDKTYTMSAVNASMQDTIPLGLAMSKHVVQFSFPGSNTNTTLVSNVTATKACANSTQGIGTCTGLSGTNTSTNYTLNESASTTTPFNLTMNITNSSLNISGSFNLNIYGGEFFNTNNNTGATTISVYNGSAWVQFGSLDSNVFSWKNFTGLNTSVYAASNKTQILFNHPMNGSSANTGPVLVYVGIDVTQNPSVTATANVTMQGSIDNVNWNNCNSWNLSASTYGTCNNTYTFVRFNVTNATLGNSSDTRLLISYLGVAG